MVTPEEELLILKQFLRFGETRPLVELMTAQCLAAISPHPGPEANSSHKSRQSNAGTFVEQLKCGTPETFGASTGSSFICCYEERGSVHHDESTHRIGFPSFSPLRYPGATFSCLVPSIKVMTSLSPPIRLIQADHQQPPLSS